MIDDSRELLTVEEAAHRLSLSRTVVYRLMRDHEVDDVKIGRARRITAASVTAFVRRGVDGDPSPRRAKRAARRDA